MEKIIHFIKYNNAFTIIFALVLFSTAGAFANEKVRDTVIGQTIIIKKGTDNTQIISANLDDFDMGLKINSVKEDAQFYYVNFDYNAIDAKDGVWQTVKKEKNLNVSKSRLGDMDLGLYLTEELKQLTGREMAYMKEVQSIEKNKGAQKQVESVEYTGLKGLVFNNETKEIIGYEPIKEEDEEDKTTVIDAAALTIKAVDNKEESEKDGKEESEKVVQQITVVKEMVSKEIIMEMVKEALAQEQGSGASSSSLSSSSGETIFGSSSSISISSSSSSSAESSSSSVAGSSSSSIFSEPTSDVGLASSSSELSSSSSSASSESPISSSYSSETTASSSSSQSSETVSSSGSLTAEEAVSSTASSSPDTTSSSSSSEASSSSSTDLSAGEADSSP